MGKTSYWSEQPSASQQRQFSYHLAGNTWKQLIGICSVRKRSILMAILKHIKQKGTFGRKWKSIWKSKNKKQTKPMLLAVVQRQTSNAPLAKVPSWSLCTNLVETADSYSSHFTCKDFTSVYCPLERFFYNKCAACNFIYLFLKWSQRIQSWTRITQGQMLAEKLLAENLFTVQKKQNCPTPYFASPEWPKLKDTWKIEVSRGYSMGGMN